MWRMTKWKDLMDGLQASNALHLRYMNHVFSWMYATDVLVLQYSGSDFARRMTDALIILSMLLLSRELTYCSSVVCEVRLIVEARYASSASFMDVNSGVQSLKWVHYLIALRVSWSYYYRSRTNSAAHIHRQFSF